MIRNELAMRADRAVVDGFLAKIMLKRQAGA
jgi:hypothetical protein